MKASAKLLRAIRQVSCALALVACTGPARAKDRPLIPDPETLVCPPTPGDLEYTIYEMMKGGGFDKWEGNMSWRRKMKGPFHFLSLEDAQWLHVSFDTIRTSKGTRLIADLTWRTHSYEFGVKEKQVGDLFQQTLDGIATLYPCPQ